MIFSNVKAYLSEKEKEKEQFFKTCF